jgi:hypothetical protein
MGRENEWIYVEQREGRKNLILLFYYCKIYYRVLNAYANLSIQFNVFLW